MTKIAVNKITDIPETMLIPLYCKATETKRKQPIIRDHKAVEMIGKIDYDFSKFEKIWMSQLGVAIRTMILDREVRNFIRENRNSVIVNLGCGLDTRIDRLKDAGQFQWYDLDVPEAIDLRKKFFEENEHISFIPKSVFDYSWMNEIDTKHKSVLIVAEGLFMYFEEKDLRKLLNELVEHFPCAEIMLETLGTKIVGRSKKHDAVKHTNGNAEFKWGTSNGKNMENWNPKLKYLNQWEYFEYHNNRIKNPFMRFLVRISYFKKNFGSRIIHLKVKK